jgi:hypothetical protein
MHLSAARTEVGVAGEGLAVGVAVPTGAEGLETDGGLGGTNPVVVVPAVGS